MSRKEAKEDMINIFYESSGGKYKVKVGVKLIERIFESEEMKRGKSLSFFSWEKKDFLERIRQDGCLANLTKYYTELGAMPSDYYRGYNLDGDVMGIDLCKDTIRSIGHLILKNSIPKNIVAPVDEYKNTPLIVKTHQNAIEFVKILIDEKANIDAVNFRGDTALMTAAYDNHLEIMAMLIKAGANIEAKDTDGKTALIWVAFQCHSLAVEMLLIYRADPTIKDKSGLHALDYAVKKGSVDSVNFLIRPEIPVDKSLEIAKHLPGSPDKEKILHSLQRFSPNTGCSIFPLSTQKQIDETSDSAPCSP